MRLNVKLTAKVECKSPHRNLDNHFPDGCRMVYGDTWFVEIGWEEDEHDRAVGDVPVRFVQVVEEDDVPLAIISFHSSTGWLDDISLSENVLKIKAGSDTVVTIDIKGIIQTQTIASGKTASIPLKL